MLRTTTHSIVCKNQHQVIQTLCSYFSLAYLLGKTSLLWRNIKDRKRIEDVEIQYAKVDTENKLG